MCTYVCVYLGLRGSLCKSVNFVVDAGAGLKVKGEEEAGKGGGRGGIFDEYVESVSACLPWSNTEEL